MFTFVVNDPLVNRQIILVVVMNSLRSKWYVLQLKIRILGEIPPIQSTYDFL